MHILGVDIGGSGIKGAPVDIATGKLLDKRHRIATPQPATPKAVADVVAKLVQHFEWDGPVGCGFPAVVLKGVVRTASNIHPNWIHTNVVELFQAATGCPVTVINDADAAGYAEMRLGAGRDRKGPVLLVTIGTGLGTVVFYDGKLLPNTEFGHVLLHGDIAERYASDAIRKQEDLSWKRWGKRFNEYLSHLESLIWPELIILGGGASKKLEKYAEQLTVEAEVVPAAFLNQAGIVGAAMAAAEILAPAEAAASVG